VALIVMCNGKLHIFNDSGDELLKRRKIQLWEERGIYNSYVGKLLSRDPFHELKQQLVMSYTSAIPDKFSTSLIFGNGLAVHRQDPTNLEVTIRLSAQLRLKV
jgi:hypothetical protein